MIADRSSHQPIALRAHVRIPPKIEGGRVLLLPAGQNGREVQKRDSNVPGFLTQPLRELPLHLQGMKPSLVLRDGLQ